MPFKPLMTLIASLALVDLSRPSLKQIFQSILKHMYFVTSFNYLTRSVPRRAVLPSFLLQYSPTTTPFSFAPQFPPQTPTVLSRIIEKEGAFSTSISEHFKMVLVKFSKLSTASKYLRCTWLIVGRKIDHFHRFLVALEFWVSTKNYRLIFTAIF